MILADHKVSFENTQTAFSYKNDRELKKSYRLFSMMSKKLLTSFGTSLTKTALSMGLPIDGILRKTIFDQFCGGENIQECAPLIEKIYKYNIGSILDYAVEGEKTEEGFDHTMQEVLRTIEMSKGNPKIPFSVFKPTGIASAVIMEKVQKKEELNETEKIAFKRIKERFETICQAAFESNVRLFIDSEDSWYQDTIDQIVYEMMIRYNHKTAIVFNTYQMYRKGMIDRLKLAFHKAAMNNIHLGVKLVRGAYMEKERERAEEHGYDDPIMPHKGATDKQYDDALRFCIDNNQRVVVCSGSHNEDSNHYLTLLMDKYNIAPADDKVWFAQLYGMSDHISFNLAEAGYNVVKYLPYGPVKKVLPYLIRRAEENTAIAGQTTREYRLLKQEMVDRGLI